MTAAPHRAGSDDLLEREQELAALAQLLRDVGGGQGRMALISGPAGIGKTRLLARRRRNARRTPRPRCSPRAAASSSASSRSASCASCSSRCSSSPPTASGCWPARRARAAPSSSRSTTPRRTPSFAALHGLYWLTVNLAAESRCCWRSTTCTGATARRCASSPTSSAGSRACRCWSRPACARRSPAWTWRCMAEIAGDPATAHARAARRSREDAVATLVRAAPWRRAPTRLLRRLPRTRPAATRCCCASCSRALEAEGVQPDAATPTSCARSARAPLPAPCWCGCRGCPPSAAAVARAVAVLGDGADLAAVAGLAGLERGARRRGHRRARPGRDPAPRPAARLRAPARARRRLPGIPAGERELQHARAAPCCADAARPPSRSRRTCSRSPPRRRVGRRTLRTRGAAALGAARAGERRRLPRARWRSRRAGAAPRGAAARRSASRRRSPAGRRGRAPRRGLRGASRPGRARAAAGTARARAAVHRPLAERAGRRAARGRAR